MLSAMTIVKGSAGYVAIDHVTGELEHHRPRRKGMGREPHRKRRPRGGVGFGEQPHRQLGVVPLFVLGMCRTAQILVGQHPQQGRPDVDALAIEIKEAIEPRWCREIYHMRRPALLFPVFSNLGRGR